MGVQFGDARRHKVASQTESALETK